jgi:hypothetical protein
MRRTIVDERHEAFREEVRALPTDEVVPEYANARAARIFGASNEIMMVIVCQSPRLRGASCATR